MKALVLVAVLSLGGCATAADQRANGPIAVLTSAKSPVEIRDCLVQRAPHVVSATPFGDGWMVARTDNVNIAQWSELVPENGGTRATIYGMRGIRVSVESCL